MRPFALTARVAKRLPSSGYGLGGSVSAYRVAARCRVGGQVGGLLQGGGHRRDRW